EKWLYYVIDMKEDFQSNLYDVFSNWIDDQWMEWFKPHVLDYIPSDFERLFNENMSFYNKIVTSKLMN
ncbi:tryptophan-rich antigen, partial [Plasmodium malariae]